MHILKGHNRNNEGLLEAAEMFLEAAEGGFRDPRSGEIYVAREYKVTNSVASIEIISQDTDTSDIYTAFIPATGECERIGMPVARLP